MEMGKRQTGSEAGEEEDGEEGKLAQGKSQEACVLLRTDPPTVERAEAVLPRALMHGWESHPCHPALHVALTDTCQKATDGFFSAVGQLQAHVCLQPCFHFHMTRQRLGGQRPDTGNRPAHFSVPTVITGKLQRPHPTLHGYSVPSPVIYLGWHCQ